MGAVDVYVRDINGEKIVNKGSYRLISHPFPNCSLYYHQSLYPLTTCPFYYIGVSCDGSSIDNQPVTISLSLLDLKPTLSHFSSKRKKDNFIRRGQAVYIAFLEKPSRCPTIPPIPVAWGLYPSSTDTTTIPDPNDPDFTDADLVHQYIASVDILYNRNFKIVRARGNKNKNNDSNVYELQHVTKGYVGYFGTEHPVLGIDDNSFYARAYTFQLQKAD
ncbi:unnamed protein product [Amaranthus hypochondriacus]